MRQVAKNHAHGRDLRVDLTPEEVDTLEICLRDLNRDLRNHLFRQLRRTTPFNLATFIMDVTGLENSRVGISRIMLWNEIRTPFNSNTLAQLDADHEKMTPFEILVRNAYLFYIIFEIYYF